VGQGGKANGKASPPARGVVRRRQGRERGGVRAVRTDAPGFKVTVDRGSRRGARNAPFYYIGFGGLRFANSPYGPEFAAGKEENKLSNAMELCGRAVVLDAWLAMVFDSFSRWRVFGLHAQLPLCWSRATRLHGSCSSQILSTGIA